MEANISNITLVPGIDSNILVMTLSINNKGNEEIKGYSIDISAKNISGLEFDVGYSDLTYEQRRDLDCKPGINDINPGLVKTSILCFEVPKNETAFNLILRSGWGPSLSYCGSSYYDCKELFINVIAPKLVVEPTGIASFVDKSKDPQSYIDRYNNEPTYKEWFDASYPQYDSIYQAVGLKEPPVGYIPEPTSESVCGTGTIIKDGICVVVDTSQTKSNEEKSSKGGGCLIATATYGSELAPQVQQLRELRDNSLLQTESGTYFMNSFNDYYYSFSPVIADYERKNPVFREMIKIAITPMVSSLSILNYVDMDSEVEVLRYGISLIILNGMMYVGIPIAGIIVIRKRF